MTDGQTDTMTVLVSGMPRALWQEARKLAKARKVTMRQLLATLVEEWVAKAREAQL